MGKFGVVALAGLIGWLGIYYAAQALWRMF